MSWYGPGIVVAVERKEGAIKRVWVRWRNKLRGFPLEFVRLATTEELQSTEITVEAMKQMESELCGGRVAADVWTAPKPDPDWPLKEFSDEAEESSSSLSTDEDKKTQRSRPEKKETRRRAYTSLDDVPMGLTRRETSRREAKRQKKNERDPSTFSFDKKRALFETKSYEEGLADTRKHLKQMKEKLRPSSSGHHTDYVGDALVAVHLPADNEYEPILGQGGVEGKSILECLTVNTGQKYPTSPFVSELWSGLPRDGDPGDNFGRQPEQQASPLTRAFCPSNAALMPELPQHMKRKLTDAEKQRHLGDRRGGQEDCWVWAAELDELWRVHRKMRRTLFVPDPTDDTLPEGLDYQWFVGPRTTQIYMQGVSDFLVDNWRWIGWNAELDLGHQWAGVTRFLVKQPDAAHGTLAAWLLERAPVEELWRKARQVGQTFAVEMPAKEEAKNPYFEQKEQWREVFFVLKDAHELAETFAVHRQVPPPLPAATSAGSDELGVESGVNPVKALPTGKVRLELKWSTLTPAWKKAFEEPICDALDVYFKHDAVGSVDVDEDITGFQILPSRFVLVNKADPRKMQPTDADLVGAKLKGRWVVAGHLDKQAGQYETEAPTASLLAHNLLCWFAAQFQWHMRYGDISAAFLQGEYLPEQRRVLVATPRGYPDFVQRFLQGKLPAGSRTDMLRLKKGGFGLAESPRMWFLKLKKTVLKLGGIEWTLIPGVFSFFHGGRVIAMVACHVDDIRMVGSTEAEEVWTVLKKEFSFGEWRSAQDG